MSRDSIVVICMPERGHLQRLLSVVEGLAARGRPVVVLTADSFEEDVVRAGGRFLDLFARCPVHAADSESRPVPSRYVSFAGHYAEAVTELVERCAPALIVYDTFAVVAPLVARRLGVPYVNFCAGHASEPSRTVAALRADGRVATSPACWRAIERLRSVHGMPDAHPFSYVECLSPHLNLYGEPEPFLPEADRPAFEPIAFFGSLDSRAVSFDCTSYPKPRPPDRPRVFVSFGTVVWRYFAPIAIQALEVLADVLGSLDVEAVVSVGGYDLTAADGRIPSKPNVRVERYVDQWAVLSRSDLFVTHHGLNSTHESIFLEVPMLSYPFFGDQPALARRCQELGVALPIAATPRAPLAAGDVLAAIERVRSEHELFARHLAEARAWELDTIAGRGAVLDRLEALARG